jgi:small basic protein
MHCSDYEKLDSFIINQVFGGLRDQFLLKYRDELAVAGFAFVVLISIMNKTVFDHVVR